MNELTLSNGEMLKLVWHEQKERPVTTHEAMWYDENDAAVHLKGSKDFRDTIARKLVQRFCPGPYDWPYEDEIPLPIGYIAWTA